MDDPVAVEVLAGAVVLEPVGSLSEHPQNPRLGDLGALTEVIRENGYIVPVVAQSSTRRVIDGNHRLKAARELGMAEVPTIWVDVDDDRAVRHLLAANRLNDRASYDDQGLAGLLTDLAQSTAAGLDGTGFDGADLDQLIADLAADAAQNGQAGDDPGPSVPPPVPVTRPGDLWVLGEHRLLCGDARDPDGYKALLGGGQPDLFLTDPPYGISQPGVPGDEPEHLVGLLEDVVAAVTIDSGIVIAFASPRTFPVLLDALREDGWKFERMLWLYKEAQNSYPWRGWLLKSEAILVGSRGEPAWQEVRPFTHDCYKVSEVSGEIDDATGWHGSIKPLAVVADLLERTSAPKSTVLDPFGGSGTTLIAAENLGRKARLIEIDPGYCDVICRRWQGLTGEKPIRDGQPHDFLADQAALSS